MMRVVRVFALLSLGSSLLVSNAAKADAFRCGSSIVQEGMTAAQIEQRCGKADLVRTTEEPVYARLDNGATVQVDVLTTDYWYYDRGPNQYVVKITIRDALAEKIELLAILSIDDLEEPGADP